MRTSWPHATTVEQPATNGGVSPSLGPCCTSSSVQSSASSPGGQGLNGVRRRRVPDQFRLHIRNLKQTPLVEKRCSAFLPLASQFPGISPFHWLIHLFLARGGRRGLHLFQKSCSCWCPRILFFSSLVYSACHSPSRGFPAIYFCNSQAGKSGLHLSSQRGLSSQNSSHLSCISHTRSSPLSWVLPPDWGVGRRWERPRRDINIWASVPWASQAGGGSLSLLFFPEACPIPLYMHNNFYIAREIA